MLDIANAFLTKSRALLLVDNLSKIERCVASLDDTDIWWRPNEASNSIGNLMLHLGGNITQWIIGGVGRRPFERDRQHEFDERQEMPRTDLMVHLRNIVQEADAVLAAVSPDELLSKRQIQSYEVTVLDAIYHVVEHFGMHTGQIILLAKARGGRDLRLWEPPSHTSSL